MKLKKIINKFKFPWYSSRYSDNYFAWFIENPLKTWWKARKYFKLPKIKPHFHLVYKYKNYPYASYQRIGKILDIWITDVMWKDKYDSPRHERNPLIWICLFRKFAFSITFNVFYLDEFGERQRGDSLYWEYLLNWLIYKERKTLRCYSTWVGDSRLYKQVKEYGKEEGSVDTYKPLSYVLPCVALSLNKRGIKELKRELNIKV